MCDPHLISREIINSNGSPDESLLFFAGLIFKEVIVGGQSDGILCGEAEIFKGSSL